MLPVIKHSNSLPVIAHYVIVDVAGPRKVGPKYASMANENCEACVIPHNKPVVELIREYVAKHPSSGTTLIMFEAVNVPVAEMVEASKAIYAERIPAVLMGRNHE